MRAVWFFREFLCPKIIRNRAVISALLINPLFQKRCRRIFATPIQTSQEVRALHRFWEKQWKSCDCYTLKKINTLRGNYDHPLSLASKHCGQCAIGDFRFDRFAERIGPAC